MTNTTCKLVWLQDTLSQLHLLPATPMGLYFDNQSGFTLQKIMFFISTTSTSRWIVILFVNRWRTRSFKINMFPLQIN